MLEATEIGEETEEVIEMIGEGADSEMIAEEAATQETGLEGVSTVANKATLQEIALIVVLFSLSSQGKGVQQRSR